MRKPLLIILLFIVSFMTLPGQTPSALTLAEAYELTEKNYPLLKNVPLTEAAYQARINQLSAERKPTVQLKMDAGIQSERPNLENSERVPLEIDLPLYSLASYLEANYSLYDGGFNQARREQEEAQLRVDRQSLETERYTLRERINKLFIHILLNQRRAAMLTTTLDDLQVRRKVLEAGVRYGTVLTSAVAQLRVRELEMEAQRSDLHYANQGLLATLSDLTGVPLDTSVTLVLPELPDPTWVPELARPERVLFQQKRQALLASEALISAERRPKLSAFAQAGVGYPNPLNFFDNNPAPYALGGVKFQWHLIRWKKQQYEREVLSLQAQQIAHQEETYVFNATTQTGTYLATVERLTRQLEKDQQIVRLQEDILRQLASQLDEGVIPTTDYLIQANAELRARQQRELHQMQLIQVQLEFLTDRGLKNLNADSIQPDTLQKQ